jgi:beta-1,4-mannosyl-glycoprotein beta-1,4-N-acetylglucosaminyltransferase
LTFSGIRKNYVFNENKERFKQYMDKIIHFMIDGKSDFVDPWKREMYQRDFLLKGIMRLNLDRDDLIVVSDCDEIMNNKILSLFRNRGISDPILSLDLDVYYYDFTIKSNEEWKTKVKILKYSTFFGPYGIITPSIIRQTVVKVFPVKVGWHFTYFGGIHNIQMKLEGFSHQEYNTDKFKDPDYITTCKTELQDLFGRGINLVYIPIETNTFLPQALFT